MSHSSKDPLNIEFMANTWAQSLKDTMEAVSQIWPTTPAHVPGGKKQKRSASPAMEAVTLAFNQWKNIASAMKTPDSINSIFNISDDIPELYTNFIQAVMGSISELQKQMGKRVSQIGESETDLFFGEINEKIFPIWTEIYEKKYQKYFQIPQIGLTREYQEKTIGMMDKFILFQTNQTKFMQLLFQPFQRSMSVMQEKITDLAQTGKLPDDSQDYYQIWIKSLEHHFMELFQTPEYIDVLTKTITSLSQYAEAKDAVMEDVIKSLPIAPKSELDDLSREVYQLKKRIRKLEQKNK